MEMAAALYRLIYGTREAIVMMCRKLNRNPDIIGRLFNKSSTVHTVAQSLHSREKHSFTYTLTNIDFFRRVEIKRGKF